HELFGYTCAFATPAGFLGRPRGRGEFRPGEDGLVLFIDGIPLMSLQPRSRTVLELTGGPACLFFRLHLAHGRVARLAFVNREAGEERCMTLPLEGLDDHRMAPCGRPAGG